jgi:hypothetical protein
MSLPGGPGLDVVRAHGGVEAGLFGVLHILQKLSGADLFMRCVKSDGCHR